jgi:hypothetical protein
VAILAGLVGILSRFAGQLLNTTLGWATLLLFGKVAAKRQTLLLVIVFGSLIWVALLIGVLVPPIGDLIVNAVPRPDFIPESWIRLGMLVGAIFLPLLIGIAAVFVSEKRDRSLLGNVVAVLRGYPFALVLPLMLVLLALVGVWRKVRSLTRRWTDTHIPVIVKPGGYDAVLDDVVAGLRHADLDVDAADAGILLSGPPKLLDLIAGRGLGDLVPDRLMILRGRDLEVLVYPSDLAISGTKETVARARAALATRVSDAPAYLTTTEEAQRVEDRLDEIRHAAATEPVGATLDALREIDEKLARLAISYEEWDVLYRQRLQVEHELLVGGTPGSDDQSLKPAEPQPSRVNWAIGLAGLALVALDLVVAVADRLRPPRSHVAD